MNTLTLNSKKRRTYPMDVKNQSLIISGIFLFAMVLLPVISCQKAVKETEDNVVAKIDSHEITYKDLSEQCKRLHPDQEISSASTQLKQDILKDMINQHIILSEAYRLGFDKAAEVVDLSMQKEKEIAGEKLYKMQVDDKILTEQVIKQFYDWSDKKIKLYRMKFKTGINDQDKKSAQEKVNKVWNKLSNGGNFQALAAEYSEHTDADQDSGSFGVADCYDILEILFGYAYSMSEGEVSKPLFVPEYHAYYILKVEKIFPQPRGNIEIERPKILEKLQELYSNRLAECSNTFKNNLMSEYHFTEFPENIDFFSNRARQMTAKSDTAKLFSEKEKRMALTKTDVEEITIGFFMLQAVESYWQVFSQEKTVKMLLSYMNFRRLMKHKAMVLKINEIPTVKNQFDLWKVDYLKSYVINKQVIEKMDFSDQILKPIYDAKISDLIIKERRTVREIFCTTENEINQVYNLATKGQNFEELEEKYSQNKETRTHGVIGPFSSGPHGKLGENAFTLGLGKISKPFRYRGGFSIIELLSIEPQRQETYEESKEKLKEEYILEHKYKWISDWLDLVKNNYTIRVHLS